MPNYSEPDVAANHDDPFARGGRVAGGARGQATAAATAGAELQPCLSQPGFAASGFFQL